MDKLKVFLAKFKKYHFWVLTCVVFLASIGVWYTASAELAEQYKGFVSKVNSQFSDVTKITSNANHPNEKFEQAVLLETNKLKKDVVGAWDKVYAEQRKKVLKWPPALGADFLAAAEVPDGIGVQYRDRYLNYVKEEFPRLLKIVDARPYWNKDEAGAEGAGGRRKAAVRDGLGGGGRGGPAAVQAPIDDHDYLVIWNMKSQQDIDQSLDLPQNLTEQHVRFCQENLWVYHALLDAIAAINKDATGHHNAKIREIIALATGQEASAIAKEAASTERILMAASTATGATAGGEIKGGAINRGEDEGPRGRGVGGGLAGAGGNLNGKPLDEDRYVDEKGQPLAPGTPGPPEFKRMPVLLQLKMDQREVAALLVELANSPLPVEIRQVRLNPKMPGNAGDERLVRFGAGGGGTTGRQGGGGMARGEKGAEEALQHPFDIGVELQGVIYIFNPPDKKLFVQTGPGGEAIPATPTPETPAPAVAPVAPVVPANETPPAAAPPAENGAASTPPAATTPDAATKPASELTPPADAPPAEAPIPAPVEPVKPDQPEVPK